MAVWNATRGVGYGTLSAAIRLSGHGDVLEVPAGAYVEDFPYITHSLTIRAVGGMARLRTPQAVPVNLRAILFVKGGAGASLRVEGLEMTGARGPNGNAAGILFEVGNGDLAISGCRFLDNEDGVLVGNQPGGTVSIEGSEFGFNGLPASDARYGLSHDLYVNEVARLEIRGSLFHNALGGHEIKSRALLSVIEGNRIYDGESEASYGIDLPNGGVGVVRGNVIQKGAKAANRVAVHFGGEFWGRTTSTAGSRLLVEDNLFVCDREGGTVIWNETRDGSGASCPVEVRGNRVFGFDLFYESRNPGGGNVFEANVFDEGAVPGLDWSR